jgi:putative restriction endonuclease
MRYWWVNQNQTYRQEVGGGYMWSPKRAKGGKKNFSYEMMREIAPGDLILSFNNKLLSAVGVAKTLCLDGWIPDEFGSQDWDPRGWRIEVSFQELKNKIEPAKYMHLIRPVLPTKYSPLQLNGRGNQFYLTEIQPLLMGVLAQIIGPEVQLLLNAQPLLSQQECDAPFDPHGDIYKWEESEIQTIINNSIIIETERRELVKSRRGQGLFRKRVSLIETECRITKVNNPEHLIASHIKPWRHANNDQRLDQENGLFLTPNVDHLFDRGLISFENNGKVIVAPRADTASLNKMRINTTSNVGNFSSGQKEYLDYHRNYVLLQSQNR